MENRKEDMAKLIAQRIADNTDDGEAYAYSDIGAGFEFAADGAAYAPRRSAARSSGRPSQGGQRRRPSSSSGSRSGSGKRPSGASHSASGKKTSTAKKAVKKNSAKAKRRRKKQRIYVAALCGMIVLAGAGAGAMIYFSGRHAYKDTFLENTYINNVDVGGMTQEQAVEELKKASAVIPESIYFTKKDGTGIEIMMSEIGYDPSDAAETLKEYYDAQDKDQWIKATFGDTEYTINQDFYYDKDELEKILAHKLLDNPSAEKPTDAYIIQNDDKSFSVIPEMYGDEVDENKLDNLYDYVEGMLSKNVFDIDISSLDIYKKPRVTAEDLYDDCKRYNMLDQIHITFTFQRGEEESLSYEDIRDWVDFDVNSPVGGLEIDRDKIEHYVEQLGEKYNTYGWDREIESTLRGKITVEQGQGCYGWWLDVDGMTNCIVRQIENCESLNTEAIWYVNPDSTYSYTCNPDWLTKDKDFSDTYVEVDLSAQHMWYYEHGEMKMESDIVSGYPSESRNTPGGVYKMWSKERGKTLVGSADGRAYASYVEFWNYFTTIGIGFHDASWQNGVFGGTKYLSPEWGSHGCINLPYDKAEYVYDNIDYGTPVFMFWTEE